MAYIGAQEVQQIRNQLKVSFPGYKFSCRKSSGSLGIEVVVLKGDLDFIGSYNFTVGRSPKGFGIGSPAKGHIQVNEFWFQEQFSGPEWQAIDCMLRIIKTASDRKWYDRSDSQTDYFDTAFYIHLSIGDWNRPYQYVSLDPMADSAYEQWLDTEQQVA